MQNFQRLRRFVLALSGAHEEVLELVPSERARFESLGWAVLITSCMAAVSMWFALSSAIGINGILAVPAALFWGLVIMGIDRWLITSMPVAGGRKFAMAVPRLLLAVLLGTLISTPLVLRVFQSEINAQLAVMQQDNYSSFLKQQQSSQVSQQVTTYRNELQQLNTVINSRGAQTGDSAADPQLAAYKQQLTQLDAQLTHWTALKAGYYTDYTCQLYGGPQCPKKGNGPAAQASYKSYQQASAQVTSYQGQVSQVQGEIRQRDQVLSSTSKASQQQRYTEALTQRPVVQAEYNTAVQRQNQLQATYYAQEQASHGILMRLEALSQLSTGNTTVSGARILLFLLFLVIECLPVTVKLLQRPGQYEAALAEAKKAEERDFKKAFAGRSRLVPAGAAGTAAALRGAAPAFGGGSGGSGTPGGQAGQAGPPPAGPEPDAAQIWTRTRVFPMNGGDPEDGRPTEVFRDPGAEGRRAGRGAPGDPPRRTRRWRGADEFRNLWSERGAEQDPPPPRVQPAPPEPDGRGEPDRRGPAGRGSWRSRPEPGSWTAETVIDAPPAPTRLDFPPGPRPEPGPESGPAPGPGLAPGYQHAWPPDDDAWPPAAAPHADAPHADAPHAGGGQPDGNGSGLPLTWADE